MSNINESNEHVEVFLEIECPMYDCRKISKHPLPNVREDWEFKCPKCHVLLAKLKLMLPKEIAIFGSKRKKKSVLE